MYRSREGKVPGECTWEEALWAEWKECALHGGDGEDEVSRAILASFNCSCSFMISRFRDRSDVIP